MHEASIISSVLEEVEYQCIGTNINKISKVILAIGHFAAVDFHALKFAFESISKDTICEGAHLEIEEIIPMAHCDFCGHEYEVTFTNKICHECGHISTNIIKGYEILLYRIEGEE